MKHSTRGRPPIVRCRLPPRVELFVNADLHNVIALISTACVHEVIDELVIGELEEVLPSRDEARKDQAAAQLMLEFLRDTTAAIKALEWMSVPLPESVIPVDSPHDIDWGQLGLEALRQLQQVLRAAAKDVRHSAFWADISGTHLPGLEKLGESCRMTAIEVHNPIHLDLAIAYPGPVRPTPFGNTVVLRLSTAALLPLPFCILFAYVYEAALAWLAHLDQPRCEVCGEPLDRESRIDRTYHDETCRKAAYRRRQKEAKLRPG